MNAHKNDMMFLLSRPGLRSNEKAIVPGAQTVRQGEGRAGEGDLTGRLFLQEGCVQPDAGRYLAFDFFAGIAIA